jgi:hypothetical protein
VIETIAFFSGCVGALLISWSVFLYEGEERRIGDALATWWIALDDASTMALSRHLMFVRLLSRTITVWLDNIFGVHIWSLRAISAACCLAFSSACILTLTYPWRRHELQSLVLPSVLLAAAFFYLAVTERLVFRLLRAYLVGGVILTLAIAIVTDDNGSRRAAVSFATALVAAIACNFCAIGMTRRLARYSESASALPWSVVAILTATAIGLCLIAVPFAIAYRTYVAVWWRATSLFIGVTNLYAGVVALSFLLLSLTLFLHRIAWPIVNRPLYAIQRFRLFQQRKVLFFAGVTLVGAAFSQFGDLLFRIGTLIAQ